MVKVKFTFKNGTTKTVSFPKSTLADVKNRATHINKKIIKVEYAPKKRARTSNPFVIPRSMF